MAANLSVKATSEFPLMTPDEFPTDEPDLPDKTVLIRYLMSAARRLLKPGNRDDLSTLTTAIHSANRRLAAARFLLGNHPDSFPTFTGFSPDWLHRAKPGNQAAFHEWVQATYLRVFRLENRIDGVMIPIEVPDVKGLTVYAAQCGATKFYGAWTELGGNFIGWMRIQPHISGMDSDYAVGEVLGRPVFVGISMDLSGHDAIDKFRLALKDAAWDLGVADGA